MSLRVWNPMADVFMRDGIGRSLEFASLTDAEAFIRGRMSEKTGAEEWTGLLDVVDIDENLRCRLGATYQGGKLTYRPPVILPFDYRVPPEDWRLLKENGDELSLKSRLRTFDGEEVELIASTPPGGRSAFGLVTCVDDRGLTNYWVPRVVGAKFNYAPPRTARNSDMLDRVARDKKFTNRIRRGTAPASAL